MRIAVRLMQAVWIIARYEECAGRVYDMMEVCRRKKG